MTNYEKIKAMSAGEMAQAINNKTYGCVLSVGCPCNCGGNISENCVAAIIHWLESEVEKE